MCRSEDQLLVADSATEKETLFEKMGDASIAVKALTKAVEYYGNMLSFAEETKSPRTAAALTSLAQTFKDMGKYEEAIPYARRELELNKDPKEICNSAFFLATLMISAKYPQEEIRLMFARAMSAAKDSDDLILEKTVMKTLLDYLQKQDNVNASEIKELSEQIDMFPESQDEDSEENFIDLPDIGAEICLSDMSDLEEDEDFANTSITSATKPNRRKKRCVVKKNDKGETQLHLACIKGRF